MYKIKQNISFGLNFLLGLALSGIFQAVALSPAQAKLSAGDFLVERMKRGEEQERIVQTQSLGTKVVSKAILNDEEGQPLCMVDIRENPDLSPPFATPAPPDFNSSLSLDLRPCDLSEMDFITHVAQNSVLGPTRVALAPLVLAGLSLFSCAFGTVAGASAFAAGTGVMAASDSATAADITTVGAGAVGAGAAGAGVAGTALAAGTAVSTGTALSTVLYTGLVGAVGLSCFGGTLYFLVEGE